MEVRLYLSPWRERDCSRTLIEEFARIDDVTRLLQPLCKHSDELFRAQINQLRHLRQGGGLPCARPIRFTSLGGRRRRRRGGIGFAEGFGRGDESVERGEVGFQVVRFRAACMGARVRGSASMLRSQRAGRGIGYGPGFDEALFSLDEVVVAEQAVDGPHGRLDICGCVHEFNKEAPEVLVRARGRDRLTFETRVSLPVCL